MRHIKSILALCLLTSLSSPLIAIHSQPRSSFPAHLAIGLGFAGLVGTGIVALEINSRRKNKKLSLRIGRFTTPTPKPEVNKSGVKKTHVKPAMGFEPIEPTIVPCAQAKLFQEQIAQDFSIDHLKPRHIARPGYYPQRKPDLFKAEITRARETLTPLDGPADADTDINSCWKYLTDIETHISQAHTIHHTRECTFGERTRTSQGHFQASPEFCSDMAIYTNGLKAHAKIIQTKRDKAIALQARKSADVEWQRRYDEEQARFRKDDEEADKKFDEDTQRAQIEYDEAVERRDNAFNKAEQKRTKNLTTAQTKQAAFNKKIKYTRIALYGSAFIGAGLYAFFNSRKAGATK